MSRSRGFGTSSGGSKGGGGRVAAAQVEPLYICLLYTSDAADE